MVMEDENETVELDNQQNTETPEVSDPDVPDGVPNGEQPANPPVKSVEKADGENLPHFMRNRDDKRAYAWKKEVGRRKEAERKVKKLEEEIQRLRSTTTADDVQGQIKMAVLESKIESLTEEDQRSQTSYENDLHSYLAEKCFTGEELAEYKEKVLPIREQLLKEIASYDPIVARYCSSSNAAPLLYKAFLAKGGKELLEDVSSSDSMRTWKNMEALEDFLSKKPAPVAQPAPVKTVVKTESVNTNTNDPDPDQIDWSKVKSRWNH